ncbi:hypothetical protein KEM52_003314 [Ascosphaera acerosa]|nr:hypothetical protein KEM52_003314 [Ascosphaera acerosa]
MLEVVRGLPVVEDLVAVLDRREGGGDRAREQQQRQRGAGGDQKRAAPLRLAVSAAGAVSHNISMGGMGE